MTETKLPPCIRSCTTPCGCPQCFEQAIHPPTARDASHGNMCRRCAHNLRRMITEVCDLYATLDVRPGSVDRQDSAPTRGKISGSPALARLDVIALSDPRTTPHTGRPDEHGYTQADDGILDVAGVVIEEGRQLAEHLELATLPATISEATALLLRWEDSLWAADWITDTYDTFRDLRRMLGRAHGEQKPRPVGKCISMIDTDGSVRECGTNLYAPTGSDRIRCRSCGRVYRGLDLVRLQLAQVSTAG